MTTQEQQNQTPEEIRKNTQERIAELAAQLNEIDNTRGAEARELLNLYGALHADPSGNAVDKDGRTAAQVYEAYEKLSQEIATERAPLEAQLNDFSKGLGMVADYNTLRKLAKERAEASARNCQEPFKDMTEFSNPQLDKIRSDLQKNPLPGGDKASIDDGTGGEKPVAAPAETTEQNQ